MTQELKQLLTENSLKQVNKLFQNTDDPYGHLAKVIAEISVKSTILVLEEYEKLNNSQ